ncbi:MAG: RNA polymerase sigma factor [Lysinibacillus sp.]
MENQQLLERAKSGDKEAYKEFIFNYQHAVEKLVYQCGVHIADVADVSQEVFVKLYRSLDQCNQEFFTTGLYNITLNIIRDYYQEKNKGQELEAATKLQHNASDEKHILNFEEDRELHEAIQNLEENERYPLVLFYFHGLKYEEITEVLDVSLSTVMDRIMAAKEKMKEELMKGGGVEYEG